MEAETPATQMQRRRMHKTAYRRTECGRVVVVDRRHLTNGAIVPNYVVDLYLPILGYEGLGILTMLYRFVNRGKHQLKLDLHKHAKVGRVGFRKLNQVLDLLEACRIISVEKPEGLARRFHHRTVIELLDAPAEVPAHWAEEVIQRTPTEWLFEQEVSDSTLIEVSDSTLIEVSDSTLIEVSGSTSIKMSPSTSMEVSPDTLIEVSDSTSIMDVPTEDVPTEDVPAAADVHAAAAAVVQFLAEQGVDAAAEFAHLDLDAVKQRVTHIQRDPDWRPANITASLRRHPPRSAPTSAEPQRESLISGEEAHQRARRIAPADAAEEEIDLIIQELYLGATEEQALERLAFKRLWREREANR